MSAAAPDLPPVPQAVKPWQTGYYKVRIGLAIVCVTLALTAVWISYSRRENAQKFAGASQIDAIAYTEMVKAAISQKLDSSKSLLQASFLVFAVLWGVVLAKKGEGKLVMGDFQEFFMFGSACLSFLLSWSCAADYSSAMATLHAQSGASHDEPGELFIMDFRDARIEVLFEWQYTLFLFAVATTGLTLLSAHLLKESKCPADGPH